MSQRLKYSRSVPTPTIESLLLVPSVHNTEHEIKNKTEIFLNQKLPTRSISVNFSSSRLDRARDLYLQGKEYIQQKNWSKAVEVYKELVKLIPIAEMYVKLGICYFRLDDFNRAARALERAAKINPKSGQAYYHLGTTYFMPYARTGDISKLKKAVQPLRKAIQLKYDEGHAHFYLGYVYAGLKNWRAAEESYLKAIELDEKLKAAYQYLASLYRHLGSINEEERHCYYSKAIETYQRLTKAYPDDPNIYTLIGNVYNDLGNREAALNAFKKAVEINGDNVIALANLGTAYLEVKQYEEAMDVHKRIIQIDPQKIKAYRVRNTRKVIDDVKIFRSDAYTGYGVACMELAAAKGDERTADQAKDLMAKAEEAFKKALKLNPSNTHAQFDLGILYFRQNKLDEAEDAMNNVLEIDPNNEDARENLYLLLEQQLKQRLFDSGLLKRIRKPITDLTPYKDRQPIRVKGRPVSETLLEDRR